MIKVIILIKATLPYHQLEKECPLQKTSKEHEQFIKEKTRVANKHEKAQLYL